MQVDEVEELSDQSSAVTQKYRDAGEIANRSLYCVLGECAPGKSIVELCKLGDNFIVESCGAIHPDLTKGQKGIAFPTCVSVNETAGHYSPYSNDQAVLQIGDVVKVDLGVHFDGYVAVAAHTVVVGDTFGRKADVIAAAWTGLQSALRLFKEGNKNSQVTLALTKSASVFGCEPLDSVLSHEMRQYVLDHDNTIIAKESVERKVNEFEFEGSQVFGLDVIMSTGKGKVIDREDLCTIYKRNVDVIRPLKLQASRALLHSINKFHPTFPFSMRYFEENRLKFGIRECRNYDLVQPYPVLSEKKGEFIAQFKATVMVTPEGPIQLSGLPLDMSIINTQYGIEDPELNGLLGQPPPAFPTFYNVVPPVVVREMIPPVATQSEEKEVSSRNKGKRKTISTKSTRGKPKQNRRKRNQKNNQNQSRRNKKQRHGSKQTGRGPSSMDVDS